MSKETYLPPHERQIQTDFISNYLSGQSVESLDGQYPFSIAEGYRLLDDWEVVRAAGGRHHSPFGKAIYFLTHLALTKLPLELLYYQHMPASFREAVSRSTLHRIARYARQGLTRTRGTALLISPPDDPTQLLVAQDISVPNPSLGKSYGALSYPMTYSGEKEDPRDSIARVLQQEVLSDLVLNRQFNKDKLINSPTQIGHILVGDVDVTMYHLALPWELLQTPSSRKLTNFRLLPLEDLSQAPLLDPTVRAGVPEMAMAFSSHLHQHQPVQVWVSELNTALALLAAKTS